MCLQPREIDEMKEYDTNMKRQTGHNKFPSTLAVAPPTPIENSCWKFQWQMVER